MAARSFWTNVTIVTATITLIGGVISSVMALLGSNSQSADQRQIEICKMAYEVLLDESPNPALTRDEARDFAARQLQLAQNCAKRFG